MKKHHPLFCREINERHNDCIVYCFCNVFKEYIRWGKRTPLNELKKSEREILRGVKNERS